MGTVLSARVEKGSGKRGPTFGDAPQGLDGIGGQGEQNHFVSLDTDMELGARDDPEGVADRLGDDDLAFCQGGHDLSHGTPPARKLN
jgi:hypothetical protein